MSLTKWTPYPGCPIPTLEQISAYVDAATSIEDRQRRKLQCYGYSYGSGSPKLTPFMQYLTERGQQENKSTGDQS